MSSVVSRIFIFRKLEWTPNRVWAGIFVFWLFMLSGVGQSFGFGSPGLLQFLRLNALLSDRHAQSAEIDLEITKFEADSSALEKSRVVQEREIRKSMGYVGENEIIFDFSLSSSSALRR